MTAAERPLASSEIKALLKITFQCVNLISRRILIRHKRHEAFKNISGETPAAHLAGNILRQTWGAVGPMMARNGFARAPLIESYCGRRAPCQTTVHYYSGQ